VTAVEPLADAMTDPAMAHPGCHHCRRYEASLRRLARLRDRALRRVDLHGILRARTGIDENANRYAGHLHHHDPEATA
jgi:hypothetical protein